MSDLIERPEGIEPEPAMDEATRLAEIARIKAELTKSLDQTARITQLEADRAELVKRVVADLNGWMQPAGWDGTWEQAIAYAQDAVRATLDRVQVRATLSRIGEDGA